MDPALSKALEMLDAIARQPRETGPVRLGEEYLRRVERVDVLPQNQSGADKTWVEDALREFREHYARVERVR